MSTVKKSHIVHGYIRNNYTHSIPEVIIRICLLYFDVTVIYKFRGKNLKKFLAMETGDFHQYPIKFNQDVFFNIVNFGERLVKSVVVIAKL